jgi:hypothetical protein
MLADRRQNEFDALIPTSSSMKRASARDVLRRKWVTPAQRPSSTSLITRATDAPNMPGIGALRQNHKSDRGQR